MFYILIVGCWAVYNVVLGPACDLAYSGSMDGTVRVWNLQRGQCQRVLSGHTSLVGLLSLSSSYLVSGSADATLRVWDPKTGEHYHTLATHNSVVTCLQHDDDKVVNGDGGVLRLWDIRDGSLVRDLLTGATCVMQVAFEGRWCVAAVSRVDHIELHIWDFASGAPPGRL